MTQLITKLLRDENGFLISAELILIATIAVIGLVVGLTEVAVGVNNELEDVGSAIGSMNQSFYVSGQHSNHKSCTAGGRFEDEGDKCDSEASIQISGAQGEN